MPVIRISEQSLEEPMDEGDDAYPGLTDEERAVYAEIERLKNDIRPVVMEADEKGRVIILDAPERTGISTALLSMARIDGVITIHGDFMDLRYQIIAGDGQVLICRRIDNKEGVHGSEPS